MEKRLNIIAVCGWAIPERWFAGLVEGAFPDADVRVLYPAHPEEQEEARRLLENFPCDLYIGYSLGSLWLLYHKNFLSHAAAKVLLAPILDFTDEEKGSRVTLGKLGYMIKQVKNMPDPVPVVLEFFDFRGIEIPSSFIKSIPGRETLLKGLAFLKTASVNADSAKGFTGLIGDSDALLDAKILNNLMPQLEIIRGAGHAPGQLLAALSNNRIITKLNENL